MSRVHESAMAGGGSTLPLVPLALAAAALVAALLARHSNLPEVLVLASLLTSALAGVAAGALWHQRKVERQLTEARMQHHVLLQLTDAWVWQTDSEHRLLRLQPPRGAPAAAWAHSGAQGERLWERFVDPEGALAQRLKAHAELPEICVTQSDDGTVTPTANTTRTWRLKGLPHFDHHGQFAGHMGVAHPEVAPTALGLLASPALQAEAPAPTAPPPQAGDLLDLKTQAEALAAEHAAFAYTVSHDLRAPIRVIDGFGRILKEDYGAALDRIGNDHLDRMVAAAARMSHMIDALLALSKLSSQPLAQQEVQLSQLAQFVMDDLQRAQPQRQVKLHIQPGLTAVGDPTLLRMVLDNLLGNAWKYSAQRELAVITFELTEHQGQPAFVVSDNGAGFDMRFADRLFGVFQRLHSSSEFEGHGVGLASVRRIVRRHGGQVWAESSVGQGARFYFTLPQRLAKV